MQNLFSAIRELFHFGWLCFSQFVIHIVLTLSESVSAKRLNNLLAFFIPNTYSLSIAYWR